MKIYLILMENQKDKESFVKIGLTTRTIKMRYANLQHYDYRIIREVELADDDAAHIIENKMRLFGNKTRLTAYPKYKFAGHTECFDNNQRVVDEFDKFISEKQEVEAEHKRLESAFLQLYSENKKLEDLIIKSKEENDILRWKTKQIERIVNDYRYINGLGETTVGHNIDDVLND